MSNHKEDKRISVRNATNRKKIQGVVLSDQVKNLDWRIRKAEFVEKAATVVISEVQEKLLLLIE